MLKGFAGDPLMDMNIAMYQLARKLPGEVWEEYDGKLEELAARISQNVAGKADDLPPPFVASWKAFMEEHGYDGTDQLFLSSPRYHESPVLLLEKLRHNVGPDINDPEKMAQELYKKRKEVQA